MTTIAFEHLLLPLPDVDGLVHGIVSVDPPKVQCDGCGLVASLPAGEKLNLLILACGITFHHSDRFELRLCRECRRERGDVE